MRKIWNIIRAPFAWRTAYQNSGSHHVQRNSVTGEKRWCHVTSPRSVPDFWKPGLPPREQRPEPPRGGSSGVKPPPHSGGFVRPQAAADVLREIKDALPAGMLEAGSKEELPPRRRLSITPASAGGFIVGEEERGHSFPFFANRYAGSLEDCLKHIEAELRSKP